MAETGRAVVDTVDVFAIRIAAGVMHVVESSEQRLLKTPEGRTSYWYTAEFARRELDRLVRCRHYVLEPEVVAVRVLQVVLPVQPLDKIAVDGEPQDAAGAGADPGPGMETQIEDLNAALVAREREAVAAFDPSAVACTREARRLLADVLHRFVKPVSL